MLLLLGAAMAVKSLAIAHRDPPAPVPAPAPALAPAFAPALASGGPGDTLSAPVIYNGREGQLTVKIPRLDADIDVDGTLTAPVWQHAAVLTGFSEYLPVDGQPADDSTEVLVWYSHSAIYFGIRAYEPHGAVHAALANRDAIDADDNVQLILTPVSAFAAGAGVRRESVRRAGGWHDHGGRESQSGFGVTNLTGPPPTDLSPDFVYESKGHLTPFGYEVVVRIPFRSIKYQRPRRRTGDSTSSATCSTRA